MIQEIEGESVLLDMSSEKYFGLNETGTVFINGIKEGLRIDALLSKIRSEFKVEQSVLESDIIELINILVSKKLVEVE